MHITTQKKIPFHAILNEFFSHFSQLKKNLLGLVDLPKEDYGALIITTAAVVSFLTFLLCILCQRKRKRRHHRQLHRNAHYDSTTSATGKFKQKLNGSSLFKMYFCRFEFKPEKPSKQPFGQCSRHKFRIIKNSTSTRTTYVASATSCLHKWRDDWRYAWSKWRHGRRRRWWWRYG